MATRVDPLKYLAEAWLVIALGLLFGVLLAGVHLGLAGRIADNKRRETYSVVPKLVAGADAARTEEKLVTDAGGKTVRVYAARDAQGALLGWVVPADGQGFADLIEMLVAVDAPATRIAGIWVLAQKETPGLGDYITSADFRDRFAGKPADVSLTIVKGEPREPHEIQAWTGATVSSTSVADIVNGRLASLREALRREAAAAGAAPAPGA